MKEPSKGFSHAKIIFIGEHSAVYGKPAIIFPIPQIKVEADIETGSNYITSDYFKGPLSNLPEEMNGLRKLINQLNNELNTDQTKINITIKSDIPLGRGLGSSAAIASAVIRSFFNFFEKNLSDKDLKRFTDVEEKITHGNPSGIDAKTVSSETPILFENKEFSPFTFKSRATLIIADTGISSKTSQAVEQVHQEMDDQPNKTKSSIDSLGDLTEMIKNSLKRDDIESTGRLMDKAQKDLSSLGVSTLKLDSLIAISKKAGALGAKLTGSGLGGCIIALSPDVKTTNKIKTALLENGASKVWYQSLDEIS